jgi:chorismate mutase
MKSENLFSNKPLIIAGPCSAESEIQLLNTAHDLKKNPLVKIFRAGIWKPRTRPGQFEGKEQKPLKWMEKVKLQTGLLTATEVATAEHAVKALDAGIDVLWIGARTTGSPIYVQEIAKAVEKRNVKVLVKNPLHPDIDLWCGAIQRFLDAGIKDIGAIHRGFFPYEKTAFRNIPLWEIPIELMLRKKNIPLFCDPSHISGSTAHLETIAQQALDLNMNGLMIEVHENPEAALTDKQQQITPKQLDILLENLTIRKSGFRDKQYSEKLNSLRREIDQIDYQLLDLLIQRKEKVESIAQLKLNMNVSVLQIKRWENILKTRLDYADSHQISRTYIIKLLHIIHKEAIRLQTEIMKTTSSSD